MVKAFANRLTVTMTLDVPFRPAQVRCPIGIRSGWCGLVLLAGVLASTALDAQRAPLRTAVGPAPDSVILQTIRARVAAGRNAGIVVGIWERDRPSRVLAAGVTGLGGAPVDGNSVFEIGSMTKAFTGALLAVMSASGELSVDDPVARFLPPTVTVPARGGRTITLLDLATQTSGLPRLPANLGASMTDPSNPYANYGAEQLYAFLSGYSLPRDIGARYEYSNLGVGLLGHALARRANTDYESLLRTRLLVPLGMTSTSIVLTDDQRRRFASPHVRGGEPGSTWDLNVHAPAGGMRSNVNDLLRFVAANLDTGRTLLSRELRDAHRVRRQAGTKAPRVGLAWHVAGADSAPLVWHNGMTGGYASMLVLDPVRGRGVVVLTNTAETVDDIAFHWIDPATRRLVPVAAGRAEVAVDSLVLRGYEGRYQLAPGAVLTVTRRGSDLSVGLTGQPSFRVYAASPTLFFYKVVEAELAFETGTDGRAGAVVLRQGGRESPAKRIK